MEVRPVAPTVTHALLLTRHYARRVPPISYAFGLFDADDLRGVCTFGMPASPPLCRGVCGPTWAKRVLELNRLCLTDNRRNEASQLVGGALRALGGPWVIVSYADTNQAHTGYVYQATNFLYTGITVARDEWTVRGLEHLHTKAIINTVAERSDPAQIGLFGDAVPVALIDRIKAKYGERFYYRPRHQKHRYVYLCGNRREQRILRAALRYPILPYPKASPAAVPEPRASPPDARADALRPVADTDRSGDANGRASR